MNQDRVFTIVQFPNGGLAEIPFDEEEVLELNQIIKYRDRLQSICFKLQDKQINLYLKEKFKFPGLEKWLEYGVTMIMLFDLGNEIKTYLKFWGKSEANLDVEVLLQGIEEAIAKLTNHIQDENIQAFLKVRNRIKIYLEHYSDVQVRDSDQQEDRNGIQYLYSLVTDSVAALMDTSEGKKVVTLIALRRFVADMDKYPQLQGLDRVHDELKALVDQNWGF